MENIFYKGLQIDSVGKTITKYDVITFQNFSSMPKNDSNVVPQTLVQMISIGLLNRSLPLEEKLIAVIGQSWEFVSKVFKEDTLYVSCEVKELIPTKREEKIIVNLRLNTINQNTDVVATGEWKLLINQ